MDGIGTSEDAIPQLATSATVTPVAVDGIGTSAAATVAIAYTPTAVDGIGTSEDATVSSGISVDWAGAGMTLTGGTYTWSLMGDSYDGTQYVDGTLAITGPVTVVLDEGTYPRAGNYVLFQYGSFPGGQAALDANLTVDVSGLSLSYLEAVQDKPHKSHVLVRLKSNTTNGKQFVGGDLTFSGPTTIYLDESLYATDGTYELFEVTGTVTGLANLTCVSDAGLHCSPPFLDGNIVKITLV